jgi:hypothetical protein
MGIVDLLSAHFIFTAQGEVGLDKRTDFKIDTADQMTTLIDYGPYTIGRVPDKQVTNIKKLVLGLMREVTKREDHVEMSRLLTRLEVVKRKLHDELLSIILRRVVTGRCRYCPL